MRFADAGGVKPHQLSGGARLTGDAEPFSEACGDFLTAPRAVIQPENQERSGDSRKKLIEAARHEANADTAGKRDAWVLFVERQQQIDDGVGLRRFVR